MSGNGFDSSNSSETKEEFGLSPHMIQPERIQIEVENLLTGLEF